MCSYSCALRWIYKINSYPYSYSQFRFTFLYRFGLWQHKALTSLGTRGRIGSILIIPIWPYVHVLAKGLASSALKTTGAQNVTGSFYLQGRYPEGNPGWIDRFHGGYKQHGGETI